MSESEILFGVHPLREAIRAQPGDVLQIEVARGRHGPGVEQLLEEARRLGIPVHLRPPEAVTRAAGSEHHQGLVARIKGFEYADEEAVLAACRTPGALVVLLDCIQDPGNLGAILRSAHALGAHAAVVPKDRAVGVTPTVRKAAAGAVAHLPVGRVTNLARFAERLFEEAGLWILGLDHDAKVNLDRLDLTLPLGVVVGSEGKGIRPAVAKACQLKGRIPMAGRIGSLNASAASAIAFYEIARQRGRAAGSP